MNNNKKGVTLVELLVVIAVMGVLAGVGFSILNPAGQQNKARDARRKGDLRQIQNALEMYRADNKLYPTTGNFPACGLALSNYMTSVPCDPTGSSVSYNYTSDGVTYTLYGCLQNTADTEKDSTNVCSPVTYPNRVSYTVKNP